MPVFVFPGSRLFVLAAVLFFTAVSHGHAEQVTLEQAVKKTFDDNPYIQIEKETVSSAKGDFQSSLGEFDWLYFLGGSAEHTNRPVAGSVQASQRSQQAGQNALIDTVNNGLLPPGSRLPLSTTSIAGETREDVITLSTGVEKKLKSGVTLTPSAGLTDYKSNSNAEGISQTDVRLKIVVPTLRGFGTEVTTATSQAAASVLKATKLSSFHNISSDIHTTIVAFYNCLAAQQSFDLVNESFERADALLANVKNMVSAGMLEPAFLNQAKAKLYSTQVEVKNGEISLYETRQVLGLAMGMNSESLVTPPLSQGNFPPVFKTEAVEQLAPMVLINTARENRMDYRAALENVNAETILLIQAKDDKKPKLDLTFQLGYAGLSEESSRYWTSFYDNVKGAYGYAGVNLELPFENNYAKGRYRSRASSLTSAKLSTTAVFNLISSEVLTAMENIKMLVSQHELAAKSAERYKAAVSFERKKYDAGESTLNALIDIEDRYIDAKLTAVETIRRYAVALAKLKFVTGTLLKKEDDELRFHIKRMIGPMGQ